MYSLLLDALDALRLRFHSAAHYRYHPTVVAAALAVVAAIAVGALSPLLGSPPGLVAFAFALTALKWLVLSIIMAAVLHYYGAPKMRLYGFIAMTELLATPLIATLYWPQSPILGFIGLLWQTWILLVQIIGLARVSTQNAGKVLLGYAAYWLVLIPAISLLGMVFDLAGWLDIQAIGVEMQKMLQQPPP